MGKRKNTIGPTAHLYKRVNSFTMPDGRIIEKDEIIKIDGEHGGKFKFLEYVIKSDSGAEWIDCFEVRDGVLCGWRSFRTDRIKPIAKKRKDKKNENK